MALIQKAISKLFDPAIVWVATRYANAVEYQLKKYGLRYDDLYDELWSTEVKDALDRLPADVILARNQRLKRALDISAKHTELPKELQEAQIPWASYLQPMLKRVQEENREREYLGTGHINERQIP